VPDVAAGINSKDSRSSSVQSLMAMHMFHDLHAIAVETSQHLAIKETSQQSLSFNSRGLSFSQGTDCCLHEILFSGVATSTKSCKIHVQCLTCCRHLLLCRAVHISNNLTHTDVLLVRFQYRLIRKDLAANHGVIDLCNVSAQSVVQVKEVSRVGQWCACLQHVAFLHPLSNTCRTLLSSAYDTG